MNKKMKKLLLIIILLIIIPDYSVAASTISEKISIEDYIKLMAESINLTIDSTDKHPYITAAMKEGLVNEGDFATYTSNITKEDAAVIANKADELLHGTGYNADLYNQIKTKKRLSDLSNITNSKQDAVIKIFSKGIMIGSSNGMYTHSRKFNGKEAVTVSEAKTIVTRVKTSSKRRKLSPDGQLIRTTNLPKNYKSYEYILESFPNAFYEKKFKYQLTKYHYKPVELVDYASPIRLKKMKFNDYKMQEVLDVNLSSWAKKVQTNLQTRLNVDYRTIDNEWISTLRKTYYVYDDAPADKKRTDDIKEYVAKVKKNKVIIKGTVAVESSTLYYKQGYYMRAYIKFKVDNATNMNVKEEDLIYGSTVYLPNLKKDKWITMYVDIEMGSANGLSNGKDLAIFDDSIY